VHPRLKRALELILEETSFQFTRKNYLQTHGTAMGTKMAVTFAYIFIGKVGSQISNLSPQKFRVQRPRHIRVYLQAMSWSPQEEK